MDEKRVRIALTVGKMISSHLRWFRHAWRRFIEILVRKVDYMEGSTVISDRRRLRKIIGKTVKRYLYVNSLNINMIYDKVLWYCLIHVVDST